MSKIPNKCKECTGLWAYGIKDGKHNKWCCKYGKPTYKAINHCNLKNGFRKKD